MISDDMALRALMGDAGAAVGGTKETVELYVGSVPYECTEEALREAFTRFGTVESVRIPEDKDTGKGRGFAFITLLAQVQAGGATAGSTAAAVAREADGLELQGRELTVREASGSSGSGGKKTQREGANGGSRRRKRTRFGATDKEPEEKFAWGKQDDKPEDGQAVCQGWDRYIGRSAQENSSSTDNENAVCGGILLQRRKRVKGK